MTTSEKRRSALIVTALPVEYKAVRSHLTAIVEHTHPQGTVYETGKFDAGGGVIWEVSVVEIGPGNPGAALETERAIAYLKPSVAFFVGVAGGVKDVHLCDVVAATKVYGYESGKQRESFEPRPNVGESSYSLVHRARAEARKGHWRKRLTALMPRLPEAFVQPIAAGEKVLASTTADLVKFLRQTYGDAVAVEMEGRGFLQAVHANQTVRALIVRGVSDLIDAKSQNDKSGYQEFASHCASAFAFEMLANLEADTSATSEPDVVDVTQVESSAFDRHKYVQDLRRMLASLQKTRSFVDSSETAFPIKASRIKPDGHVEASLPNVRFQVQAKKLSVSELREKYGGAELNYEDYLELVTASKESVMVNDVVRYLANMRAEWVVQILGGPGMGKSFILRDACNAWAERQDSHVPFWIELRDAPPDGFQSPNQVLEFISKSLRQCAKLDEQNAIDRTKGILSEGKGVVFFDGIDELSDPVQTLRPIAEFMRQENFAQNRFVFSCRTFDQVPGLVAEELVLLPISQGSLQEYLTGILGTHPLISEVNRLIHNPQFRRVLDTPLVATAFTRFIRDRNRLPKSLYELLSDTLRQRFIFAAVQHHLLALAATDEEINALYFPTSKALHVLAFAMVNRLSVPKRLATEIVWEEREHWNRDCAVDPIQWAEWSGVLYETSDGNLAFGLNRYKELYLAEKWTDERFATGEWPEDVKDRIGRVLWTDVIVLLGDLAQDPEDICGLILDFFTASYHALPTLGIVDRYRFIEAAVLLSRLAGPQVCRRSTLYHRILYGLHLAALHPLLTPTERAKIIGSFAFHASASAADVLFAMYDDALDLGTWANGDDLAGANFQTRRSVIEKALLKSEANKRDICESALDALADLIEQGLLDQNRVSQFIRRADEATLQRLEKDLQANSNLSTVIKDCRNRKRTLTSIRQAGLVFGVPVTAYMIYLIISSLGVLGIALVAGAFFLLSAGAFLVIRYQKAKRLLNQPPVEYDEEVQHWFGSNTGSGVPYSPKRYWLPEGRLPSIRVSLSPFQMISGVALIVSIPIFVISLVILIARYMIPLDVFLHLLLYALYGLAIAAVGTMGWVQIHRILNRRIRQRQEERKEREWRDRLIRVSEESIRLSKGNPDVDYIVTHLMEEAPDIAVIQARLEAIRRHMVSDPKIVEKLRAHAEGPYTFEVQKLILSAVDDVTRTHVLEEEKRRYQ